MKLNIAVSSDLKDDHETNDNHIIRTEFASFHLLWTRTNKNTMTRFKEFKNKEKFLQDDKLFYSGISDRTLKLILTEKISFVADVFIKLADKGTVTDNEYQDAIKNELDRFTKIYLQLDTEDRERICGYFEELMDIVELESSGGHLNSFMYGFNP